MRHYQLQASAVKMQLENLEASDKELNFDSAETKACLRDAVTTLLAVATVGDKTIIENQKLRAIVEEFCIAAPDIHYGEILAYKHDFEKILNQK